MLKTDAASSRNRIILVFVCLLLTAGFLTVVFSTIFKENEPDSVIQNVEYTRDAVSVVFESAPGSVVPEYRSGMMNDSTFFIDIENCDAGSETDLEVSYGHVERIRHIRTDNAAGRIELVFRTLHEEPAVSFIPEPPQFRITFNRNLEGKKIIVIDPGHGGELPGAVGRAGTKEKDVALDISIRLKQYLDAEGRYEVVLTRADDRNVSLYERRTISRFWEADLFLSIHANSSLDRTVNRTEVYYSGRQNMRPAEIIRDDLAKNLEMKKGIVRRRGFAVLRRSQAQLGSILVESLYISNPAGEKLLSTDTCRNKIAFSLFESVTKIIALVNN